VSKRLLASYLALTAGVLLALEIPLALIDARTQRQDLENAVQRDAFVVASLAEDRLQSGGASAGLNAVVLKYRRETGGRVVVVDRRGRSIADSQPSFPGERNFASRPEIAAALTGKTVSGLRFSRTLGHHLLYVAVPVASAGTVYGAVRITYPTSALDARVNRDRVTLLVVALLVLAWAAAVGLVLAHSISGPLRRVEETAVRVGAGDLAAVAPEDAGPPEVRRLAAELNRTTTKLAALIASQEQFVADASHQLRTPLAALRLRLENLESEVNPAAADDVEGARAEVERLTRLVDGLLTLARAQRHAPAPVDVDVGEVLAGRRDAWLAFAGERGVTLVADDAAGLSARATPERLEQVLDNLLNNALEVAPSGTTVTLRAGAARGRVEVRVRDAGPGMTAGERARAFDRFWRGAATPGDNGGFGLGLAIVRQLISADGGTVELESPPGGGLEAVLTLRAGAGPASGQPARGTASTV